MKILKVKQSDGSIVSIPLGKGADGKSAYEVAREQGFEGNEEEWLASLKGKDGASGSDGKQGDKGDDGYTPQKGVDYFTEADKQEIANKIDVPEEIYVGDGEMPEGATIQIITNGDEEEQYKDEIKEYVDAQDNKTKGMLVGTQFDTSEADTIYAAKKKAEELVNELATDLEANYVTTKQITEMLNMTEGTSIMDGGTIV